MKKFLTTPQEVKHAIAIGRDVLVALHGQDPQEDWQKDFDESTNKTIRILYSPQHHDFMLHQSFGNRWVVAAPRPVDIESAMRPRHRPEDIVHFYYYDYPTTRR